MRKNVLPQLLLAILVVAVCVGWSFYEYSTQNDKTTEEFVRGDKRIKRTIISKKFPVNMGLDLRGGVHVVLECKPREDRKPTPEEIEGVIKVMTKRINPRGVSEIAIYRQGDRWVNIDIPGERDPDRVRRLIGKTAKLEFLYLGNESMEEGEIVPAEWRNRKCGLHESPSHVARAGGCVVIEGADLKKATPEFGDSGSAVGFQLNKNAATRFFKFTRSHVSNEASGKMQYLAIALDGAIISCPHIKTGIPGGRGQISGTFNQEEMTDLVTSLNSGALPVDAPLVEMRAVSPTLGKASIYKSFIAGICGFCAVILFMIAYYRLPGALAGVALCCYVAIVLGIMSMLNAVLTLPGIAGFIVSIGMAVDANVIIFERLKEELKLGKTLRAAIEAGFTRAFTAIFDSNVTTLIAAVVLYSFGSGPIRGFAVTLSLGILVSMFSAITITKVLLTLVSGSAKSLPLYGIKPQAAHD